MDLTGPAADPVVDPVLGGNAARQQGSPCREQTGEAQKKFSIRTPFSARRSMFGVRISLLPVAAQGPIALVVGENQNHVGAFFYCSWEDLLLFFISIPDFCVHGL